MTDGGPTQDAVRVEDGQLRVDARPAVLVAQLQSSGGEPYVTIHSEGGSLHRAVPGNVRTGTYRLSDEVTVEAVRASTFVAVEEGGRLLVAAFGGEVVLRTGTDGDRLALAPHEGVLVPVAGGEPRVVALADAGSDAELTSMVDRVTEAMAAPEAAAPASPPPAEAEPEPEREPKPETAPESAATTTTEAPPAATAVPAATPTPAAPTTAGGARSPGKKGKKGKKARQRQAQQQRAAGGAGAKPAKQPPPPAATASPKAAQGDKADKADTAAPGKKTAAPTKAAGASKKKASVTPAGAGARPRPDGGSHIGRRVAAVVVALAAVIAAVLVLTRDTDDGTTVASEDTTTTEAETSSTSETSAPPETSTTEPPATTTTEAPPATTTTVAAPVANYRFVPRSCVQSGNTITYTASITNQAQATFDYLVRVRFVDTGGTEVATANASVNDVRPGQTREVRATGTSNRDLRNSGANCEVVAVEPTAS